ncbi:hypothetical protein M885DRAFT_558334 [Pelagophyceae sp. CCMP2097]|nr:hypothetical protein M885DRAFT_558334 [Pelagophyceae sp. CCMP2097]
MRAALALLAWRGLGAAANTPSLYAQDAEPEVPTTADSTFADSTFADSTFADSTFADSTFADSTFASRHASDYVCSVPVRIGGAEIEFMDRPGDLPAARLANAAAFAGANGLAMGGGCDAPGCVAAMLVADVDGTVCAKLFRAGITFVPVGFSCYTTFVLADDLNARGAAFPFDWNNSPLDAVVSAVECAFVAEDAASCAADWYTDLLSSCNAPPPASNYADVGNWAPSGLCDGARHDGAQAHVPRMTFPNDFVKGADAADFERVFSKYIRRFRRLAKILHDSSGAHVYLVHPSMAEGEAQDAAWRIDTAAHALNGDGRRFSRITAAQASLETDVAALRSLIADRPHVHAVSLGEAVRIIEQIAGVRLTFNPGEYASFAGANRLR